VWFTVDGSASSGADAQVSPVSPPPVQLPAEHAWVPAHITHALPDAPHALFDVPLRHTSPWQQPVGQVEALHVAMHEVPLHTCDALHVEHCEPEVPHAPDVVPGMHTLPWQQPVGHVDALHAKPHWPLLHVWLLLHALHAPPPVPHALDAVPGRHTLPLQQPLGHVVALQVDVGVH
jgi:hypothetical protein